MNESVINRLGTQTILTFISEMSHVSANAHTLGLATLVR